VAKRSGIEKRRRVHTKKAYTGLRAHRFNPLGTKKTPRKAPNARRENFNLCHKSQENSHTQERAQGKPRRGGNIQCESEKRTCTKRQENVKPQIAHVMLDTTVRRSLGPPTSEEAQAVACAASFRQNSLHTHEHERKPRESPFLNHTETYSPAPSQSIEQSCATKTQHSANTRRNSPHSHKRHFPKSLSYLSNGDSPERESLRVL